MLRVVLAVVTLLAFTGGVRAEYFCFGMQRTMARCCCSAVDHENPPRDAPSIDRAPCCERRVKEAPAPIVRLDGSAPLVPKAPLAAVMSDPFVVHPLLTSAAVPARPVDWGPRAGPRSALYERTSRYLI